MRRWVVLAVGLLGLVGLVAAGLVLLARSGEGPLASKPTRLAIPATEVRTLGQGGDPLVVEVLFPWHEDGYCSGQFTVTASESDSAVVLGPVTGFERDPAAMCAGLGTVDGLAAAPLTLRAPLGDRVVTRSGDGAVVPARDPCEVDGRPGWCPRPVRGQ